MYLLNNVIHSETSTTLDLPSAGVIATRFEDGSMILALSRPGEAVVSRPSANLLAELIAGNLGAPEPDEWIAGDVVTFTGKHGGASFAIRRRATNRWSLYRNGKSQCNENWRDADVDKLVDGKYTDLYTDVAVVIRGSR